MENLVNKIIEIDRMADSRIVEAQKSSRKILSDTETKCVSLKRDISYAADKRITEIEKINKTDFDMKIAKLEKKYADEKMNMDRFFDFSHLDIENKIFAEIVGE
ncbi:MAG: hypothetical protein NC320_06385 [Clostridium sp.]|nr:hypothetical protein [Clostridium sp.]MCM1547638.1 hypothetical protein [Ruminococcus sp.]